MVAAGAVLPWSVILVWFVADGPGATVLWDTLVGFRIAADRVMAGQPYAAVTDRLAQLPLLAAASGLARLVLTAGWLLRHRLGRPVVAAAGAMLVTELAGLALGGVPTPAGLAARARPCPGGGRDRLSARRPPTR